MSERIEVPLTELRKQCEELLKEIDASYERRVEEAERKAEKFSAALYEIGHLFGWTAGIDPPEVSIPRHVKLQRDTSQRHAIANRSIRSQVEEFHHAMGQPVLESPTADIPAERVRLRAALIAEEFFETMRTMFKEAWPFYSAEAMLKNTIRATDEDVRPVHIDLVALADGLADLDYVVEGTRLEFGIDGAPIAAEVHRSNMAKTSGPIASNGKRLKPPGWTPPDIAGELAKQKWRGSTTSADSASPAAPAAPAAPASTHARSCALRARRA